MISSTKNKIHRHSGGFTMIEVLVGLVLGIMVLGGLVLFLFQTSGGVQKGINHGQITSKAQQALDRMAGELKNANTEAPQLLDLGVTLSNDWANLPHLPYLRIEIVPYQNVSGSTVMPTAPAARHFLHQSSTSDPYHSWYPNPFENYGESDQMYTLESNSIVFYKINRPAPGQSATVSRVTYRTLADPNDASNLRLIREEQQPMTPTSNYFHNTPNPQTQVLAEQVLSMHFTYPDLIKHMEDTNGDYQDDLLAMNATDREEVLNSQFRKEIALRLVLKGAKVGNERVKGIELKTEVKVRN